MGPELPNKMNKGRIIGMILLVIICAFSIFLFKSYHESEQEQISAVMEFSEPGVQTPVVLANFNPNDLSKEGWVSMGFTEQEANTILNWKDVLGGSFTTKNQLKKCYAISPEKYNQLHAYISLPENKQTQFKQKAFQSTFTSAKEIKVVKSFNPDHYAASDWQALGFSAKQAEAIIKYKNYLGGSFLSKDRFKDCFIISPENYAKLEPYLLLPDFEEKTDGKVFVKKSPQTAATTLVHSVFDPNDLDSEGWKNLGFSEKQAVVIVNYRDRNLRGSFKTLEDVQRCFVISPEKFEELKPFMAIKTLKIDKEELKRTSFPEKAKENLSGVDLNEITEGQLLDFGFEPRAARNVLTLRKNLGGFADKNQIFEAYGIDRELASQLLGTIRLNPNNVQKYTLVNAPESWLKTHPYFKYSAEKILFYRISEPDDKKIWKFIKVKPEYEARMKMYLK